MFACCLIKFYRGVYHVSTTHGIATVLFNTVTTFPAYVWCNNSHVYKYTEKPGISITDVPGLEEFINIKNESKFRDSARQLV